MRIISAIFVLALAVALSGCDPAVSIRPLYTEADLKKPVAEPRIEGDWVSPDLDKPVIDEAPWSKWKIAPPKQPGEPYGAYSVDVRPGKPDPGKGDGVVSYEVRLVAIGDKLFFDAEFTVQEEGQVSTREDDLATGLVGSHVIGRVWIGSDYLRIAFLDSKWVQEHSPANFQESKGQYSVAIITASTQDVRDFLLRNSDDEEAMALVSYLCHPGVDCAMRRVEDELSRLPKDEERRDEILKNAALVFLARGNYDGSLQLQRRRLESRPDDSSVREDFGRALLFKRDFRAARSEFTTIQKSAEQKAASATAGGIMDGQEFAAAEAAEGIVWSYFIEGDYAGAVTAFANYKGANGFLSANAILLSYFSLRRLGKRTEADAFLNGQSVKFRGPADDHLLLLDLQNRIEGKGSWQPPKGDALQRFYFYQALRVIDSGNAEAGRSYLQSALEVGDASKDALPALAARVELDRLGPPPKK